MSNDASSIVNGLKSLWAIVSKFLLARLLLVIAFTAASAFGGYWYATYVDIANRLDSRLAQFETARNDWIVVSASVFSNANVNLTDDARLPSRGDVLKIQETTTALVAGLAAVPTPTASIESAAAEFRVRLSDVILAVGRYDGTPETTTRIVEAAQIAARAGYAHHAAIEDYLGSAYRQLAGSI